MDREQTAARPNNGGPAESWYCRCQDRRGARVLNTASLSRCSTCLTDAPWVATPRYEEEDDIFDVCTNCGNEITLGEYNRTATTDSCDECWEGEDEDG